MAKTGKLHSVDGDERTATQFLSECLPGLMVGVFDTKDKKWHEKMLLFPGEGKEWFVVTATGKVEPCDVGCAGGAGKGKKAFLCDDMGTAPDLAKGAFLRFGAYPEDSDYGKLFKKARVLSDAARTKAGASLAKEPKEYLDFAGERVRLRDVLPARGAAPSLPKAKAKAASKEKEQVVKADDSDDEEADDDADADADEDEEADDATKPADKGKVEVWRAIEEVGDVKPGDVVAAPSTDKRCGVRGIVKLKPRLFVFARLDVWDGKKLFLKNATGAAEPASDARVLAVESGSRGRGRTFPSYVDAVSEEDFDDFPITGPRSVTWCLEFLRKRHQPSDHHLMFKTAAKLQSDQWGVQEHEHLMRFIEFGCLYDQLDLTNLAIGEALFRRAQTIEWVYHDKLRDAGTDSKDRLSPEEMVAFSGLDRTGDQLMVAPSLLEHVRGVVEKDAATMNNIRKARKERELRKTKK